MILILRLVCQWLPIPISSEAYLRCPVLGGADCRENARADFSDPAWTGSGFLEF